MLGVFVLGVVLGLCGLLCWVVSWCCGLILSWLFRFLSSFFVNNLGNSLLLV
jgi:hypothetical protein